MLGSAATVHADILRMAKTEEKRERIKWFYARRVFFDRRLAEGLMRARESNHPDARFLVSLFPAGAPTTFQEAARVFEANSGDVRCLCWAAAFGGPLRGEQIRRVAESGNAWAQMIHASSFWSESADFLTWMEKAVAQGEPDAMWALGSHLWNWVKESDAPSRKMGEALWREAAELGDDNAQRDLANLCCPDDSLEQVIWLRRAALQEPKMGESLWQLCTKAILHVQRFDDGLSGRAAYEIGAAIVSWECLVGIGCKRAVELYKEWQSAAKRAVLCWMWLSRELGVVKDIRRMIGDRIWDERVSWGDNVPSRICSLETQKQLTPINAAATSVP